jgi:hypothetical protein
VGRIYFGSDIDKHESEHGDGEIGHLSVYSLCTGQTVSVCVLYMTNECNFVGVFQGFFLLF